MKIYTLCAALVAGALVGCQSNRETSEYDTAPMMGTQISELPPAVERTVRERAPGAKIDDIDKEIRSGRTVYEISFAEPGINPKMHVAEDGTFLKSFSERAGEPTVEAKFKELPSAVQDSLMRYAPYEPIADIDSETKDGQTVYEVEFKKSGKNPKMQFNEDGVLLSQK